MHAHAHTHTNKQIVVRENPYKVKIYGIFSVKFMDNFSEHNFTYEALYKLVYEEDVWLDSEVQLMIKM